MNPGGPQGDRLGFWAGGARQYGKALEQERAKQIGELERALEKADGPAEVARIVARIAEVAAAFDRREKEIGDLLF